MIREHEFNTNWLGKKLGIVFDPQFFNQSTDAALKKLNEYEMVEFNCKTRNNDNLQDIIFGIAKHSFMFCGSQIHFKFALARIPDAPPSVKSLEITTYENNKIDFAVNDLLSFSSERYALLPSISEHKCNERYFMRAQQLIKEYPKLAVKVSKDGITQGWFFSQALSKTSIDLTLAMGSKDLTVSGLLVYYTAIEYYKSLGYKVGQASYSILNHSVHNIYASFNASAIDTTLQWIWVKNN